MVYVRPSAGVAIALALLLGIAPPAQAGWTPEPGHGYAKLWIKWLWGFSYQHGDLGPQSYPNYNEVFFATYGNLGLFEGVALSWQLDMVRLATLVDPDRPGGAGEGRRTHVSPGDPAFSLRWRFFHTDRAALSFDAGVRVPLAPRDARQTLYSLAGDEPEPIGQLRLGSGSWSATGAFGFGYAFDRWYIAGSAGYEFRSDGFDDRLIWSLEAGMSFSERWGGTLRLSGAHSLPTGDAPYDETPSGVGNGTSYSGMALEVDYEFRDLWFVGLTLEGGLFHIVRQTGGPVLSLFVSTQY